MRAFLAKSLWPVVAGFVVTSAVMMVFETINHFLFPFPAGMDTMDLAQVQAFAKTLPWTASLMVLGGWAVGPFAGGALVTKMAKGDAARGRRNAIALGVLLLAFGVLNNFVLLPGVMPVWFSVIGLPLLPAATMLGNKALLPRVK